MGKPVENTHSIPAGVPPTVMEAARDTLGGALALAERLPDRLESELVGAAREAFTQGLHLAAVISAAVAIALAVAVVILLRHLRGSSEPAAHSDLATAT